MKRRTSRRATVTLSAAALTSAVVGAGAAAAPADRVPAPVPRSVPQEAPGATDDATRRKISGLLADAARASLVAARASIKDYRDETVRVQAYYETVDAQVAMGDEAAAKVTLRA